MKTLVLDRRDETEYSKTGTEGVLSETGIKICDTLELHEENNKPKESHIPTGTYLCKIVQSPKFGKVYEITEVTGRGNVLIHCANFAGDTDAGMKTQLLGCVALGNGYGLLEGQRAILQSRKTFDLFMQYMKGLPFKLQVIN